MVLCVRVWVCERKDLIFQPRCVWVGGGSYSLAQILTPSGSPASDLQVLVLHVQYTMLC